MNKPRELVKWAPFSSVINANIIKDELIKERKVFIPPEFDEDVILNNELKLKKALVTKRPIKITYYLENDTKEIKNVITKLDSIKKEIVLANHQTISFYQIIKIS